MDHAYIEDQRVAERYLLKDLTDRDRAAFEAHFPDCPECLDRLALAELFRTSKNGSPVAEEPAQEEPAQAVDSEPDTNEVRRPRLLRSLLWLGGAAFVLLAIPSALFLGAIRDSREQLLTQAAGGPVPLYALQSTTENGILRPLSGDLILTFPAPDAPSAATLRADLVRGDVRLVWTAGFVSAPGATIALRVPAAHFEEGPLRLDLIAKDAAGRSFRAAFFRLRVQ